MIYQLILSCEAIFPISMTKRYLTVKELGRRSMNCGIMTFKVGFTGEAFVIHVAGTIEAVIHGATTMRN